MSHNHASRRNANHTKYAHKSHGLRSSANIVHAHAPPAPHAPHTQQRGHAQSVFGTLPLHRDMAGRDKRQGSMLQVTPPDLQAANFVHNEAKHKLQPHEMPHSQTMTLNQPESVPDAVRDGTPSSPLPRDDTLPQGLLAHATTTSNLHQSEHPHHHRHEHSKRTQPDEQYIAAPRASGHRGRGRGREEKKSQNAAPRRGKYRTIFLERQRGVLRVENRYLPEELIGHGAYGIVCAARDLKENRNCAIKKIENTLEHRSYAKRTLRELIFLRLFDHENILKLHRVMRPVTRRFRDVYLVTEILETDLACVIRSPQSLSDDHVQFFVYQVLRGVKYMHSVNVIHRDLKPRNLLVNSNCDLKVCDFGLARFDDRMHRVHMTEYVATRWYRAPEVIAATRRYSTAMDVWSIGCIMAELIGRRPLFPGENAVHQLTLINSFCGSPPSTDITKRNLLRKYPNASEEAIDLMARMLVVDPNQRITAAEALTHQYLADLHDPVDEPDCMNFPMDVFEWERRSLSKDDLRTLLHNEICDHNDVDIYEPPKEVDANASHFLQKDRKKKKTRRRRSF